MGALQSCFSNAGESTRQRRLRSQQHWRAPSTSKIPPEASAVTAAEAVGVLSNGQLNKALSVRKDYLMSNEQATAAAALLLQHSRRGGGGGGGGGDGGLEDVPFDRSVSVRQTGHGQKKQGGALPRSSSTRPRSLADPVIQPMQLVDQGLNIGNLETNHFVLVHGGGFGAWCWYKTISLLQDSGFKVKAIDLKGSGISTYDTNNITSLAEYSQPLTSFLEMLGDDEKVILVGHDFGGSCISYAMEMFPSKIAKAIFLCAAMLTDGQNTLDMFMKEAGANNLLQQAQVFVYSDGKDHPLTAIDLDQSLLKDLLFNESPSKDAALALVSMRSIPFAPILEKLSLSKKNYGSIRRFYIETTEDNLMSLSLQQHMCNFNPPEKVFTIKGSDHSPFFSKPQALHKLLVDIAKVSLPKEG